jgi:protein SCO1/2
MQNTNFFTAPRITVLIILAFLAFVVGSFVGKHWHKPLDQLVQSATIVSPPRVIEPFQLTDTHKQVFTNQNLQGHWTLLFFGFTQCGYVCPTTMATLKQVYENLQQANKPLPQVMFISIDPERDTLKNIQQYVTSFNPSFQGSTGNKQQIEQFTKNMSVVYMKVAQAKSDQAKKMNYQIDHSGALLLVDPKGELFAVFSMPHNADVIAHDFTLIASHERG